MPATLPDCVNLRRKGIEIYASDEGDKDWKNKWVKDRDYSYELVKDGDKFSLGNIYFEVKHTPGYTPEHLSYTVMDGAAI